MHPSKRFRCAAALCLVLLAIPLAQAAPTAGELELRTYRNIPYRARFLAEADGENVSFEIVRQPRHGTVTIDGSEFLYTPEEDRCGSDSFSYLCRDGEGNASTPAEVRITVARVKSGVNYSDMEENSAAAAAQFLAEEGIFTGTHLAGEYFFEPEREVSRAEFLTMTMAILGMDVSTVTVTGFADDAAIPTWAKSYASAALRQGVVQGSAGEEGAVFRAEEPITFREAAVMLDRALAVRDVDLSLCFDGTEDDSWAAQALGNLEYCSILAVGSFGSPTMAGTVTRADAAEMLAAAAELLTEEETGLLSWLHR